MKKYVKDGTLKLEWRDFPYLGQESVNAAIAARAAQAQGKFWEYHDLLYKNQSPTNSGGFSDEKLVSFAKKTGLDVKKFEADLKSGKYESLVQKDFKEGQNRGISATPTFIINGKTLAGLQPLEVYKNEIEAARKAKGG